MSGSSLLSRSLQCSAKVDVGVRIHLDPKGWSSHRLLTRAKRCRCSSGNEEASTSSHAIRLESGEQRALQREVAAGTNLAAISDSELNSRIVIEGTQRQTLILASASPRRKDLLARLALPFQIVESGIDENISIGDSPSAAVFCLAIRKAESVAKSRTRAIVLAADTVIDFRGTLLGKPTDKAHAKEMLRMLRGRTHAVLTGIAVLGRGATVKLGRVVSTEVRMRSYSESVIEEYVESGEPFGKAGSYAIQDDGARLIESICGCYNNVVGLPLCETVTLLKTAGVPFAGDGRICQLPTGEPCPRVE